MIVNNYILKKYLRIIVNGIKGARITDEHFQFRCNVCGDSKTTKNKKRGYILLKNNPITFYCHNCNYSTTGEKWMKKYFPTHYDEYIKELLSNSGDIKIKVEKEDKSKYYDIEKLNERKEKEKEKTEKEIEEEYSIKKFVPILSVNNLLTNKAINQCNMRMIPKEIWSKWYVCSGGIYADRMIIPFYDNEDRIYYFQARTLSWQIPKYLNMRNNRENAIYNYYNIDRSKPVIVTEGPIDSIFISNSIAVLGTTPPSEVKEKISELNCYYWMDNDEPGKKISKQYLREEKKVFLWKKFIQDNQDKLLYGPIKDVNDLYLNLNLKFKFKRFTHNQLSDWFSNNLYDEIYI